MGAARESHGMEVHRIHGTEIMAFIPDIDETIPVHGINSFQSHLSMEWLVLNYSIYPKDPKRPFTHPAPTCGGSAEYRWSSRRATVEQFDVFRTESVGKMRKSLSRLAAARSKVPGIQVLETIVPGYLAVLDLGGGNPQTTTTFVGDLKVEGPNESSRRSANTKPFHWFGFRGLKGSKYLLRR